MLALQGEGMDAELDELKAVWLDLRAHVDALAEERQHYLDFFQQAAEAYVVTDPQGTILDANGAAIDVLQRRRRALCGKPIAAMVALERRAEFRFRLSSAVERQPGASVRWSTVFEAPELRTEVSVTVRLIERESAVAGVCWLLQPVQ
jgi:PAS domain S-box-containing protein